MPRKPLPTRNKLPTQEGVLYNSSFTDFEQVSQNKKVEKLNGLYGLSPKLPLSFAKEGSYTLLVELRDLIKQNFKNLMLTEPGERIMDINFGAGLKSYIFELLTDETRAEIENRIYSQTSRYMSYIEIEELMVRQDEMEPNYLVISIYYKVPDLKIEDYIVISLGE